MDPDGSKLSKLIKQELYKQKYPVKEDFNKTNGTLYIYGFIYSTKIYNS